MLRILLAGVPQFGLVVNPQKVVVNFELSKSTNSCPGLRVLPLRCLFPWCGLLLDTHTLDTYKDYSRWRMKICVHLLTFFWMNSCRLINHPLQLPWTLYRLMNIREHSLSSIAALHCLSHKICMITSIMFHFYSISYSFLFLCLSYSYANLSLRYSLTLGSCHSAGQQMKRKLMALLRLKCHALFVDHRVREIICQS